MDKTHIEVDSFLPQRVKPSNLQRTIENLENATSALSNLKWLSDNSGYSFDQVNTAIKKLVLFAAADILYLRDKVVDIKEIYEKHYSPIIDSALYYLDRIQQTFRYITYRKDLESTTIYQEVEKEAVLLNVTLKAILPMRYTACDDTCGQNKPAWWQRDDGDRQKCQQILKSMENNSISLINDQTEVYIHKIIEEMDGLLTCLGEYKLSVENAVIDLNNIVAEMNRLQDTQLHFNYDEFLKNTISKELSHTKNNISWLSDLQLHYSRNETTKVNLSYAITSATERMLSYTMDAIIAKLETTVISTLQTRTEFFEVYLQRLLQESIDVMIQLEPYFAGAYIEERTRKIFFWRHPVAELATPNIVRFQYSDTETWRTWPRSVDLQDLNSGFDRIAAKILPPYAETLLTELHDIRGKFIRVKYDVLAALEALVADLAAFNVLSAVDKNFIT